MKTGQRQKSSRRAAVKAEIRKTQLTLWDQDNVTIIEVDIGTQIHVGDVAKNVAIPTDALTPELESERKDIDATTKATRELVAGCDKGRAMRRGARPKNNRNNRRARKGD